MKVRIVIWVLILVESTMLFHIFAIADQIVITKDGRRVLLKDDGTWEYVRSEAAAKRPVLLYTFKTGKGDVIRDVSGIQDSIDLVMDDPNAMSWIPGGGISINSITVAQSKGPGTKVINACMATNEITIEAWAKPANTTQGGPARIVTFSVDGSNRNFSLTQNGAGHEIRLRTTTTGNNGTNQRIRTNNTIITDSVSKYVYTRDASGQAKFYINGIEVATASIGGNFSNWDANYQVAIGHEINKLGDRDWVGEIHLIAVYDRALTPAEVRDQARTTRFFMMPVEPQDKLAVTWARTKVSD
jgi:hypothetical protein